MPSSQSSSSRSRAAAPALFSPAAVWLVRVIIGATFIVSGFAKSVDPWGSFYKIGEYLDVWGWDIPQALVVLAAFALGCSEFVTGCLVMLGCYRRVAVWLLAAMMAFMLPLTLYIAVADPVADCGCFGDFLILSNTATFLKNVVISILLVYLLRFNSRVDGLFFPYVQWVVGGLVSLYIFIVALIGYNVQPMVDFRRFAPGTSLLPADEADGTDTGEDGPVYEFIYEKDGERRGFTIDSLPDPTWTFVDRRVTGGAPEETSDGFAVIDEGEDITADIISPDTEEFLVTIPDMHGVDLSYTYLLNELNAYITGRGGSMVALVSGDSDDIDRWRDISMASYPIYSAEPTLLKELARGHAAIVYLTDGTVRWKRALSSISYATVTATPAPELLRALDPEPTYWLYMLSIVFGGLVFIIMVLDRSGRLVAWHIGHRRRHLSRLSRRHGASNPADPSASASSSASSSESASPSSSESSSASPSASSESAPGADGKADGTQDGAGE